MRAVDPKATPTNQGLVGVGRAADATRGVYRMRLFRAGWMA